MNQDSTKLRMEAIILSNSPTAVEHKKFGVRNKSVAHNQGPRPLFNAENAQKTNRNTHTKSPAPF